MEKYYKPILEYWEANIEDFQMELKRAYKIMGRERVPLDYAAYDLYTEMYNLLEDFCLDNELDIEDFDIEDILMEA